MELDKRIMPGKRPLTCFDLEQGKDFVGKKGYFADYLNQYSNISDLTIDVLKAVSLDENECTPYKTNITSWKYFLPSEWVEEKKEPKYRPFTLAEWIGQHTIGDVIRYRCKSQKTELRHLYVGYGYGIGTDIKNTTSGTLTLGVASYTLDYLLEDYEIEVNGEWLPFGVIDE